MRKKFVQWSQEPLIVPRWLLTAKYALFVILGTAAAIAGVPSIDLTTWPGYSAIWAGCLILFSALAAVASLQEKWESWEKWMAVGVLGFLLVYVAGAFALIPGEFFARLAFTVLVVIVTLLPGVRVASLIVSPRKT